MHSLCGFTDKPKNIKDGQEAVLVWVKSPDCDRNALEVGAKSFSSISPFPNSTSPARLGPRS